MIAYHGKADVKAEYLKRVRLHREADEIVQGYGYWSGGRGCAVGCTIHGSDHGRYETELGIPRKLARLEDGIFEALPIARAIEWPEDFLEAITPGSNLEGVADKFLHWLLVDKKDGVIQFANTDAQRKAIADVGELYWRQIAGETVVPDDWRTARAAAAAAAAAAAYAAAAAAAAAAYAADAAAAAAAAYAADAAADADGKNARVRQAEKMLELLRGAGLERKEA